VRASMKKGEWRHGLVATHDPPHTIAQMTQHTAKSMAQEMRASSSATCSLSWSVACIERVLEPVSLIEPVSVMEPVSLTIPAATLPLFHNGD